MRRPLRSDAARAIANLAIDLGDPGRMAKARRLHRSNAVGEVDITPSSAATVVTDIEGNLHDVTLVIQEATEPGEIPAASSIVATCSCDDHGETCVHGLAALLGIAESIEADPALLLVWTGSGEPKPVTEYSSPSESAQFYLRGRWPDGASKLEVPNLPRGDTPDLTVDEVDAGPVVVDAISAIRDQVSGLRAR